MVHARNSIILAMIVHIGLAGAALANTGPAERFSTPVGDPRGITLAIEASCVGESVAFRVKNTGPTWPSTGVFGVFTEQGAPIRQWSRRLTAGQTITFTRPATAGDGHFVFRVPPNWVAANATAGKNADAKIVCS
ncbi:MAG: hypothetical protein EXQ91_01090 [Alphaproteobacteria bacterium]|nr:hypothetical protein [Alphaproteobacteria bacterium]